MKEILSLVYISPESVTGATLSWFTHLDIEKIWSLEDLADMFVEQFKYNA